MTTPSKVLVTGGAGFIGSHLVEALLQQGRSVAVIDNFDNFYTPALKHANVQEIEHAGSVRWHEVDIRDYDAVHAVFQQEEPDVVVHLAARAGVRPSIEQPALYHAVNVAGTLNILVLAQAFKVKKFIFGSSSSVYGAVSRSPFAEDQVNMKPISPYAATKLCGELFCYTYSHLYHLSAICLRFFTVYGPRQRPDLAIRKFTDLMMAGKPIPIFGDGNSGRDYTYVDDIVSGILAAIDYEAVFEIFNLGNSNPVRLIDMVRTLEKVTGYRALLDFLPPQAGDVPYTCADLSKSRQLLGYDPRTSLQAGLEKFWTWYQETPLKVAPRTASR